jgi:hypothetical protein
VKIRAEKRRTRDQSKIQESVWQSMQQINARDFASSRPQLLCETDGIIKQWIQMKSLKTIIKITQSFNSQQNGTAATVGEPRPLCTSAKSDAHAASSTSSTQQEQIADLRLSRNIVRLGKLINAYPTLIHRSFAESNFCRLGKLCAIIMANGGSIETKVVRNALKRVAYTCGDRSYNASTN